jgi:hypothetical protein
VTDDLDRLLGDAPREFPRPDPELTDAVRRNVLERLRRTSRRRTLAVRFLPVVIVAAAASAFAVGHWLVGSAASASDSRSLLVRTTNPRLEAVWCRSAVMVYLDPPGRVTVLQYAMTPDGSFHPTGATIAYVDAKGRSLTRVCPRGPTPTLRPNTLVGPWPRSVASRVGCYNPAPAKVFQIEVLPILNRARRQIGNRLLVVKHGQKIVDARVMRHGGGISLDPLVCFRNEPRF